MKALVVHQHFNTPQTGGALRSYYLAKALVENGIETVVITAHAGPYQKQIVEGVEVHYLPIAYQNSFGFYRRVSSFAQFVFLSVLMATKISHVSFCYAMSTPLTVGLAGVLIKWIKNVPLFFETGDLWPDAPIQLGFIKNPLLKYLLIGLERFVYWQSKAIVALSVPMKKMLEQRTRKPVHLIPNMADIEFFTAEEKKSALVEKFDTHGKFVISYIGSVGYANGLDNFLECARAAQKANLPVLFLLCGDGAMLPHLCATAAKLAIDNLKFVGSQHRAGVADIMNVTDAVFISYRHHTILETGSPNKYFDGLAAGKLIIVNFGGWIRDEIEKERCGFYVDATNLLGFTKPLVAYIENRENLRRAQQRALQLANKYDRKKLAQEFATLVTTLN